MTDKEAMKLALFALDIVKTHYTQSRHINEAITALKERLAQDKALQALHDENERLGLYKDAYAEPVAHWSDCAVHSEPAYPKGKCDCGGYTTPPQRTEQNFCSRCGKRTPDLITIHTCTPPREGT